MRVRFLNWFDSHRAGLVEWIIIIGAGVMVAVAAFGLYLAVDALHNQTVIIHDINYFCTLIHKVCPKS